MAHGDASRDETAADAVALAIGTSYNRVVVVQTCYESAGLTTQTESRGSKCGGEPNILMCRADRGHLGREREQAAAAGNDQYQARQGGRHIHKPQDEGSTLHAGQQRLVSPGSPSRPVSPHAPTRQQPSRPGLADAGAGAGRVGVCRRRAERASQCGHDASVRPRGERHWACRS